MLRRLAKDESGVVMGLVIIMVVLIGVLGAGLLVFVQRDLNALIQTNQGQRALDIADAGVQDAKRQLYTQDATRQHYDLDHTNDCAPAGERLAAEDWSLATTVYVNRDCSGGTTARPTPGVTKSFADGKFSVTIRCYKQEPVADCAGVAEDSPETAAATDKAFFKVVSVGEYGGAKRKVEAIYVLSQLVDVPKGYFADKGNIEFNGNFAVSGVSFFSGKNIIISEAMRTGNLNRTSPALYGDWTLAPFNTERREDATRTTPRTGVGLAAAGFICSSANSCTSSPNSNADGVDDYDSSTGPDQRNVGSKKKFIKKNPATGSQSSSQISFPFDPNKQLPLELLKEEAIRQGNYYASRVDITNSNYPMKSNERTVFFVDSNSTTAVDYTVNRTPQAKGTIVINNGNLKTSSSSNGLNGIAIITGDGSSTGTGNYVSSGSATINGFVLTSGGQTISGSVNPSPGRNFNNAPGFYAVKLWSWRELYQ